MWWAVGKLLVSAGVISFTSWLAGRKPLLAGFLVALPLTSMLALALNYTEFKDPEKSVAFAKSIFLSVPLSLTFFVPFLLASRIRLPFWGLYFLGVASLAVAYFLHRALTPLQT